MPLQMECCRPSYDGDLGLLKLVMRSDNDTIMGSKPRGLQEGCDGRNRVDDVNGKFFLLDPGEGESGIMGLYDKPLPWFGCGVGWFSFVVGFICPPFWYYATVLYFGNYRHPRDPRERDGLAASAIAALISTVIILASLLAVLVPHASRSH
ncbi:hypothetical protein MLD38_035955 [Melastoma candidum]|uniref:Uncharacterized protein n=1 Tax=Melastoma candidum TaxID=119954 RepID=A0ACB9LJ32_9MYRT|nr:hypothetical protein MLD38_035955 [Melastoma candidum]